MAGINQNLKASITFGGNIDRSWKRSTTDLQKNLKAVGKESERLTKDQTKLATEIKKAKLAGNSISDLKRQYSSVTREIRKTEAEQQKLNRQIQKAQRLAAFRGAGKGLFRRGLGMAGQLGGMVAPGLAIGGSGVAGVALSALAAPLAMNAETARRASVAKSYGVDVPTFDAWDSLAKQYDMSGENIGDLFEEYLHKAGEYRQNGKQGSLQDAFETLGFKAGDLAGLSDMAQFEKIVERALSLQDESKASFALDSLSGGEASKLLMLLKQSGKSYRDLMDEQRRYNLVTRAGAEGAMAGNKAVTGLRTVFSSAVAEISGLLGNELSPDIRELTDDLAGWFKGGGIKRIVGFLKNDLYPAMRTFGQGIVFVGKIVYALAKKLAWLLPDERSDQRDVLKTLAVGGAGMARARAASNGQGEWLEQQMRDNPTLQDDLQRAYAGTGRFFRDANDEAFNKTLDKYLPPENSGTLSDWNTSLQSNRQQPGTQANSGAGARDNYPLPAVSDPPAAAGVNPSWSVPDSMPGQAGREQGQDGADGWDTLLQRIDLADKAPPARQLTDNRRFEFHYEIHGAPGQDERAIGDEVVAVTKTNPIFNGDSSMLDGGQIW
ncbi:hypothetical protein CYD30_11380 [Kosakonia cowanii]|nr:hypothetical protein CYD30_11380 [Kosakonia cowanii]